MNVLKIALICGYLISGFLIQGIADDNVNYDLEKIVTLNGHTYRDILIMEADTKGLLFRHRDGIAKLGFSELAAGLRAMYQLTDDEFSSEEEPIESGGLITEEAQEKTDETQIELTSRTRVVIRQQSYSNHICYCPPVYWPQQWSRYHSAHELVNPACRAAVLQDFLYTTGLVPRPPGVYVHRLPSATPWRFRAGNFILGFPRSTR